MENIYIGITILLIIYVLYYLLIISNDRRLKKFINKSRETTLVGSRFKINYSKVDNKMVAKLFAINNASIISLTYIIVMYIDNIVLKLLSAFLIFTVLIVISYLKIGKYIKKKEVK